MPSLARGEASGVAAPGAIGSRGVADEAPGHLGNEDLAYGTVQVGVSIGLAFRSPRQRTSLTDGWKLLEQGPESQAASWIFCGGVSAVMGSSDLDGHTFHPSAVNGYTS